MGPSASILAFAMESPKGTLWYRFILFLAREIAFRALGGFVTKGWKNIPLTGPVIIAPNHMSFLDPPLAACGMKRALTFMAKEELFKPFFLGWLIRSVGAFPIRRGENDTSAIRMALDLLNQGRAVIVFPEGTRGQGKVMGPILPAVPMLAKRTGAWVVPVGITGTQRVWPKGQSRPGRGRMTIRYGKPFRWNDLEALYPQSSERDRKELFSHELATRIRKLCEEDGLSLRIGSNTKDPSKSRSGE